MQVSLAWGVVIGSKRTDLDYNESKDMCKRCKLRQREQIFDGGSYFCVSTANVFVSSLTGLSETKPVGISKWELDMVNNFSTPFPTVLVAYLYAVIW